MADASTPFELWCKENKFLQYLPQLEEEGYDDLVSLILLSDAEVEELCTAIGKNPPCILLPYFTH